MVYALSGWHVGWLQMAWLRYVGRISYSMYLIHFLVLAKLRDGHHHNQYRVAAAALAITLVYASLSWFLMEKPLLTRDAHGKGPIKTPTVREAIAS
jgi:peptidoglycan/LPS O-acetylase OafA/YrhL